MLIIRFQHRLLSHAGVDTMLTTLRNSYWIIGARRLAKSVKRECVSCQRQDSRPCCEPAGPLPRSRVTESSAPFNVTGIDFAGPVFAVDRPGQKFYICLFTCATTRALHLEITDSLSLPAFVLALRRFAARRGWPSVVYSDNAATFKACAARLKATLAHSAPEWRFIVPTAPWYGGWWEVLVRSVKVGLRKSLGQRCLTRDELETVLLEIESCVNSRPLTFVSDEAAGAAPLTPNHFLIGRSSIFVPDASHEDPESDTLSTVTLSERDCVRRDRLQRFWRIWREEYVRYLPAAVPKFGNRGSISVGSVVLIRRDNVPRLRWPMATVVRLHPGKDGVVRSVDVRTSGGLRSCPVQRLHSLELADSHVKCDRSDASGSGVPIRTRSAGGDQEVAGDHVGCERSDAGGSHALTRTRSGRVSRPPVMFSS